MLAFAVVLSILKLVDLPYGGSITICSMLPIALIAYRYGTRWGLLTAFAFSLIQMLDGVKNLQYATSFGALVAIMLLDYILAFLVLGLCGIFRGKIRSQSGALTPALFWPACCVISATSSPAVRYGRASLSPTPPRCGIPLCITPPICFRKPWCAWWGPSVSAVCWISGRPITRLAPQQKAPDLAVLYRGLGIVCLAAAVVFDIQHVFPACKMLIPDSTSPVSRRRTAPCWPR